MRGNLTATSSIEKRHARYEYDLALSKGNYDYAKAIRLANPWLKSRTPVRIVSVNA